MTSNRNEPIGPDEFLRELALPCGGARRAWMASFPDADDPDWQGSAIRVNRDHEFDPRLNHYVSTAMFPPRATGRVVKEMLGCVAIVIDDPTTKGDAAKLFEALGRPTARVRTSRDSYHWWYFLKEAATAAQVRPVLAKIKTLGLGDASGNNAVRYARLPCGTNNKGEHGEPFRVRMVEWTGRRFGIDEVGEALGVEDADSSTSDRATMNEDLSDDELEEQVTSGESYHDAVMVLAARHAGRGRDADEIADELRRLMRSCPRATRRETSWQKTYDDIERFVDTAVKKFAPLARSLDDFVSYLPSHGYLFLRTMQLWSAGSVDACVPWPKSGNGKEAKRTRPSAWLDKRSPTHAMTWHPGEPRQVIGKIAVEGGWEDDSAAITINTYKAPVVKRGVAARAGRWLRHLRRVFPDTWRHVADWLAFKVQNPGVKINHALVLAGSPGIGKDTLLEPVRHAVGVANYKFVGPRVLLSEFNPHFKSVILHVSEARDLGPNDRFGLYESNKDLIAAPPATVMVNEKHMRPHWVFNLVGVIFTTNYPVDGLYIPPDDRRHHVSASPRSKTEFDDDYWRGIWDWYGRDGIWHVVAWLRERDVSGFNPGAEPAHTDAWRTMVQGGASSEDLDMHAAVEALGHPKALTLDLLRTKAGGDLLDFLSNRDTRKAVKHRLAALGYYPFANEGAASGLWKIGGEYVQVYVRTDAARSEAFAEIKGLRRTKAPRQRQGDDLV